MTDFTQIGVLEEHGPEAYCRLLAKETEEEYGVEHVTPLTGGGDDPFIYWWTDDKGERHGYIRGSYTRERR